jgi:hypothetical protein
MLDTFLAVLHHTIHLVRFLRHGIGNDIGIDRECHHCDDLNNLGLLKTVGDSRKGYGVR